jgi:hypothetical protein
MNYKEYALSLDANEEVIFWIEHNLKNYLDKFELKGFIKSSIDYILSKNKRIKNGNRIKNTSSGDYSKNASSGNGGQNASSGFYSDNASSGDSSNNASSGSVSRNVSSGNRSKNASSGDYSKNVSIGDYSQNASSGFYSGNASSGDRSKNASSGDGNKNKMLGKNSVSVDAGNGGIARGKIGCWFCLSEWGDVKGEYAPICVKAVKIDGKKIKEDAWYKLQGGKFIEVKEA